MKALKTAAIVLGVFILIAAGAAGWLLASFDAARLKQELAAAVERQTGRVLKIDGELALGLWPDVAVTLGRASLSERGGKGETARLERARVAVAVLPLLSRRVVVKHVEVDGLAVSVVKRRDGTLSIADLLGAPAQKASPGGTAAQTGSASPPPELDIAGIRIANARLDWRDEAGGGQFSLADLDFSSGPVRMAAGKLSAQALTLAARLDSAGRKLAATLSLSDVASEAGTFRIGRFALDADARMNDAHVVAKLASPVALDLDKQTVALTQLAGQLDLTHPRLPMKTLALPLAGAAHADLARQSAGLRLDTRLDASTIKAKLDIGKFAPLALAFDLDIDQLDLDKYLPPEEKVSPGGTAAGGGGTPGVPGTIADPPIDLSALKGLDLKGTVKVGALTAAKLKATNLRLQLDARNGRLTIAPLSANLYDGRLAGSLALDAHGNRVAAKQTLTGVRIDPLLKDLTGQDRLAGRGDVALDIAGHGATVGALKKTLAGTARIALADGAVKGINIGQKLREARALLKGGQTASVADDRAQQTDFSALSASFRLANGVARNDDLLAKSPLLRIAGAGDIDIGNGRLDYLLKASVVATSTGQGGKELEQVKGITLPVRLTGPFDRPDWKIELAGVAEEAVKAKVAEKKAEIREKARDQLKNKLKGLFK
ncbi:MAG: AsmA family protein [Pseudomonadota bacterium]